MLSLDQIRLALKDRRIDMVRDGTGLGYHTILAIRDGKTTDPNHSTVLALSNYLERTAQTAKTGGGS